MVAACSKPGFDYGLWQSYILKKRAVGNIPETYTHIWSKRPLRSPERSFSPSSSSSLPITHCISLSRSTCTEGLWDKDAWPTQQEAAYGLLQNFQPEVTRGGGQRNQAQLDGSIGLSFAEIRDMICHGCGKKGHRWRICPELNQEQILMILEKLKAGTSAKKAIKDAVANVSIGADAGKEECIDRVTNMNVQGADKASIQSAKYQDMNSDDDGDSTDGLVCKEISTALKS
jgi:hypothetical protein